MPFLLDEFNEMYNSDNYYFYSKHRSKVNKVASVWLIDLKEEFSLCEDAIKKRYLQDDFKSDNKRFAYNLKRTSNKLAILGESNSNAKHYGLIIAKFNNDIEKRIWHGYPADYIANQQDKPNDSILKEMIKKKLITPREMNKIKRGLKI